MNLALTDARKPGPSEKFHNASDKYPNGTLWDMQSCALWDLCNRSEQYG